MHELFPAPTQLSFLELHCPFVEIVMTDYNIHWLSIRFVSRYTSFPFVSFYCCKTTWGYAVWSPCFILNFILFSDIKLTVWYSSVYLVIVYYHFYLFSPICMFSFPLDNLNLEPRHHDLQIYSTNIYKHVHIYSTNLLETLAHLLYRHFRNSFTFTVQTF